MIYDFVNPPFSLNFKDMTKVELKNYYDWFLENIPIRVQKLESLVNLSYGFENWRANYEPSSLSLLGKWFSQEIEVRERTINEYKQLQDISRYPVDVNSFIPTDKTYSIAFDIGMYFGEVYVKNHSKLSWGLFTTNKKSIDYGQPVIKGFGKVTFNPIYMLIVQTMNLIGKKDEQCLIELYNIWEEYIPN